MGLLDRLYSEGGAAAEAAELATWMSRQFHVQLERPSERRSSLLPADLFDRAISGYGPHARPAIAGAGITLPDRHGERYRATVFLVDVAQERQDWAVDPTIAEDMYDYLGTTLGVERSAFDLAALPRPVTFGGPGEEVRTSGVGPGTLGARVRDSAGQSCLLTAGHVAPSLHAGAFDEHRRRVGTVQFTASPQAGQPNIAYPDVALIRTQPGYNDRAGVSHDMVAEKPRLRMDVSAVGAVTSGTSWVKGICESYVGEHEHEGGWGNVLITRDAVSSFGDSGAPVLVAGTPRLVGHVVAGYPGSHTLIQEIDYQLDACGATLR